MLGTGTGSPTAAKRNPLREHGLAGRRRRRGRRRPGPATGPCSPPGRSSPWPAAPIGVIRWSDGIPLDVGRRYRTETPALRRALEARDRGCRCTGCGMPAAWCTAHHLSPGAKAAHQPQGHRPVLLRPPPLLHPPAGLDHHRRPQRHPALHPPQGWLTLDSPLPGAPNPARRKPCAGGSAYFGNTGSTSLGQLQRPRSPTSGPGIPWPGSGPYRGPAPDREIRVRSGPVGSGIPHRSGARLRHRTGDPVRGRTGSRGQAQHPASGQIQRQAGASRAGPVDGIRRQAGDRGPTPHPGPRAAGSSGFASTTREFAYQTGPGPESDHGLHRNRTRRPASPPSRESALGAPTRQARAERASAGQHGDDRA